MINSIELRGLRNGEFVQFLTDFQEIIERNEAPLLRQSDPYRLFQSEKERVNRLYKAHQLKLASDDLADLDKERDLLFNGIRMTLEISVNHPQAELRLHAQSLRDHLNTYGKGVAKKNYPTETAILKRILDDWRAQPALTDSLAALHLTPWQDKLEEINQRFNHLYVTRAQEAGVGRADTMKDLRKATVNAYYKLRGFIQSLQVINEKEKAYGKVISEINGLIGKYKQVLSRKPATADGEAPPAAVPPPQS
jgi:hypothetical protein